jgi:membrane-anchored glycerophosphoryl diester phosphodiesterase (GDPDase)
MVVVMLVAGLYIGVRLAMSVPAAVIEGRRWPQAMTRSWSLVHGHWGHVVATLFLAWLATGLVGSLLVGLTAGFTGLLFGDGWLVRMLLQAAVMSLVVPYLLIVWVLLYLDLRTRRERLDLDTLKAELRPPEV